MNMERRTQSKNVWQADPFFVCSLIMLWIFVRQIANPIKSSDKLVVDLTYCWNEYNKQLHLIYSANEKYISPAQAIHLYLGEI